MPVDGKSKVQKNLPRNIFSTYVFKEVGYIFLKLELLNLLWEFIGLVFQLNTSFNIENKQRSYGIFFVVFSKYYLVTD